MRPTLPALLLAVACAPNESDRLTLTPSAGVERVEVMLDAGDVSIATTGEPSARLDLAWSGEEAPEADVRMLGATLFLDARCPAGLQPCATDAPGGVPANVSVRVFTGQGDVSLAGVRGGAVVDAPKGDVTLNELAGGAVVIAGRDVRVREIDGEVDLLAGGALVAEALTSAIVVAGTGPGDLTLQLVSRPELVVAEAGTGGVTVRVPRGDYDVSAVSDRGQQVVEELTNTAEADAVIRAHSDRGDVIVRGE